MSRQRIPSFAHHNNYNSHIMSSQKKLLVLFWSSVFIALLLVAVFETDTLMPGAQAGVSSYEYIATMVMELLTIVLIPLALRLFKFRRVQNDFSADSEEALFRWGTVRMGMLAAPMIINTLLYYVFMNVAFGYMAIIGLLSMVFIYPSKSRCEQESR